MTWVVYAAGPAGAPQRVGISIHLKQRIIEVFGAALAPLAEETCVVEVEGKETA